MTCPACGHANRAERRFCADCGAALPIACPSCQAANESGDKFCGQCGAALAPPVAPTGAPAHRTTGAPLAYTPRHLAEKILGARHALEGERKQVTVLFADVQGSMELAEQVDPEEWHAIMDRFFAILTDAVHRFEGTVNQYTGDGVMALFGAPIAHEDHAQRACHAALQLRDALRRYGDRVRVEHGLSFSARMGLNSGEVVVGRIGDDLRMDYTAQGHTVGLAARMEQLAQPGTALLTEHTARLATGYFLLRDLGPTRIKGASEPLRVHELEGIGPLRTRFDAARARGLSRFVGRERELAMLEDALGKAMAGRGQVVGIVAEPGIGKSRLCFELAARCRARGLSVAEAHGFPHGRTVPLLPWLELLRTIYGLTDRDSPEAARDKIAGRTLRYGAHFVDVLPLLFDLLGVPDPRQPAPPMDPDARQRRLAALTEHLIHARSERGEVDVYILEDLHWFDAASEAFFAATLDAIGRTRSLSVVNFRPEYQRDWMAAPWYRSLRLEPLGDAEADHLLRELLGDDPALAELGTLIRARTGGNPFFIEEAVQTLREEGVLAPSVDGRRYTLTRPVLEVRLPATVQSLLAARIDRLPDDAKTVLHTAAVIGKRFAAGVLQGVLDATGAPQSSAALAELERAELIIAAALDGDGRGAVADDYAFKHPLTQEVAYRSQLADRRARTHAAVARVLTGVHERRLEENAALLAHHWESAGEQLEAARWHRRAAEWVGLRDRREAARHWKSVGALVESLPLDAESAQLGTVSRFRRLLNAMYLGQPEDEQLRLFTEGRALALAHGGPLQVMLMSISYGLARTFAGAVRDGVAELREALRIADASGDRTMRFLARASLVNPLHFQGRLHEALTLTDEAFELSGGDQRIGSDAVGFSPYATVVLIRSVLLARTGALTAGDRELQRARDLVGTLGDAEAIGTTHVFAVLHAQLSGEGAGALDHARTAVDIAERNGSPFFLAGAYGALGCAHLLAEEWDAAVPALEHGLAIVAERRTGLQLEPAWLAYLADARLGQGDAAAALALADRAIALARERDTAVWHIEALLARCRALRATTGANTGNDIARSLDEAAALIAFTGAASLQPFVALERARLAGARDDAATEQRERRAAYDGFVAIGATGHAAQLQHQA